MRYRPLAAAALIAGLVLVVAAPASAHNYLVASTPAANSTLTELPDAFSVTTNESLLDLSGTGSGFAIEVTDAAGRFYGDGCVTIVDATMATEAALGDAGEYTLAWQLVSEDGHTVSGEFGFTWAPAAAATSAPGSTTAPNCGGAAPVPDSSAAPVVHQNADLGDVLWIVAAIAAILIAAVITFVVVTRKRR